MKKILIIEDDQKVAMVLEIRFQANGYETVTARTCNAGATLARSAAPNLIVLDISLPDGNGLNLARQLKLQPETKATPIIFVTGSKDPELRERAMMMGIAGLVEKPYDPEELLDTVRMSLGEFGKSSRHVAASAARTPCNRPSKQILIIEDDQKIALALAVRLKCSGYETITAYDAVAGVSAAVKDPPDLVLVDITMPGGNGFTVAERIQTLALTPIPIIFLTASKQPGFRQRANLLKAAGYLEKPYEPEQLLTAIQAALSE
jgi:DNA-binding response OmpR family regulator